LCPVMNRDSNLMFTGFKSPHRHHLTIRSEIKKENQMTS
jgi:hypothetical protein